MTFLNKLNYIGFNDQNLDENTSSDNQIKEFVDSLFAGNTLDIIKYKYPKLNQSLNELTDLYQLLNLDSGLDDIELKVEIAKNAYQLTNLKKKNDELAKLKDDLNQLADAKKKLINKKETLSRLMKKGNVVDNLKTDVEKVKKEFKECYNKAKATEKFLDDIGFRSVYSTESMEKLNDDILNVESKIEILKEFTSLFDEINSEEDLKIQINLLNEQLKNYKDFFIKNEDDEN